MASLASGLLVLALVTFDVVKTTLSGSGGGPVTGALARGLGAVGRGHPAAGPVALVLTAVLWTGLFWAGWALVFLSDPAAAVSSSTGAPVGTGERIYYAGYNVITLGLGDVVPGSDGWRMAAVVSAAVGLVFITLGVSYYTAVLGAVVDKRRLSTLVAALGRSPADIVAGAWDGSSFPGMGSLLTSLADLVAQHDRQHEAYPVLHLFGERRPDRAAAVQHARLDEALRLWAGAVAPGHRPPPGPLRAALGALGRYLDGLEGAYVTPAQASPPPPDLGPLRAASVPLVDDPAPGDAHRRRLLLGHVEGHGFAWSDVDPPLSHLSPTQ